MSSVLWSHNHLCQLFLQVSCSSSILSTLPTPPAYQEALSSSGLRHPFPQLLGVLVANSSPLNPFLGTSPNKRAPSSQIAWAPGEPAQMTGKCRPQSGPPWRVLLCQSPLTGSAPKGSGEAFTVIAFSSTSLSAQSYTFCSCTVLIPKVLPNKLPACKSPSQSWFSRKSELSQLVPWVWSDPVELNHPLASWQWGPQVKPR